MHTPLSIWIVFFVIVLLLMVFDLTYTVRGKGEQKINTALKLSFGYFMIAVCFGIAVVFTLGRKQAYSFFTGYFVEESLSMDNIFVISMVFEHFRIPASHQRRVLLWGILGAVFMRGVMVAAGITLVNLFHPILYFFGIFLVITGIKMLFAKEEKEEPIEESALLRVIKRFIPVSETLHGNAFFVGKVATPLFLTLISIELADAVFAIDSVPAVLSITTDPFIVYTSNIFAILGLRALYFALAASLHRFAYLKYSLALVLVFIGGKIFLADLIHISALNSLVVTLLLLLGGIVLSLRKTK